MPHRGARATRSTPPTHQNARTALKRRRLRSRTLGASIPSSFGRQQSVRRIQSLATPSRVRTGDLLRERRARGSTRDVRIAVTEEECDLVDALAGEQRTAGDGVPEAVHRRQLAVRRWAGLPRSSVRWTAVTLGDRARRRRSAPCDGARDRIAGHDDWPCDAARPRRRLAAASRSSWSQRLTGIVG